MKLEQQVVSLEIAKKLKELGVKQESLFWWSGHTCPSTLWYEDYGDEQNIWKDNRYFSAFTVAELGEIFPETREFPFKTLKPRITKEWATKIWLKKNEPGVLIDADTEADARGKMLCYLLEQGIIKL